jgi:hypothetical protein
VIEEQRLNKVDMLRYLSVLIELLVIVQELIQLFVVEVRLRADLLTL